MGERILDTDPRASVAQPVREALAWLVLRGVASFAVAIVAILPTSIDRTGTVHAIGHVLLPGLLVFVVLARAVHAALDHDRVESGATLVWGRAFEVDRIEAVFAITVTVAVPIAWLAGIGAIVFHHIADPPPGRGFAVGIALPLLLVLWFAACLCWLGDCRERLDRAERESSRRFRDYWAALGRSKDA